MHRAVPRDVCFELGLPEFGPRRRSRGVAATLMAMPKTAMHENDRSMLSKHQIRSTMHILRMQPEPETTSMQCPPQRHLGLCVSASDPSHHPGPSFFVDNICHKPPGFLFRNCYTTFQLYLTGA